MIGLGTLGRHALEARHLIENLIETEEFSPKPEAAYALWLITGEKEKTLEVLMKYIDSPTYDFRVLPVLEAMGPEAAGVADELAKRLGDDDQGIRLLAVKALGAIGPAAAPHLDALKIRRTDSEDDVVAAIDEAITKIAPSGD
jgi:HEAT repeat protein